MGPIAGGQGNAAWQLDLSVSHSKVGDVLVAQGYLSAALEAYEAHRQIAERLVASDPGNGGWQRDLSVSHNEVGDVLRAQGDLSGALDAYEASLQMRERLAASDPGKTEWQRDLAMAHSKLAQVADSDERREHLVRCRDVFRGMRKRGMHLDPRAALVLELLEALDL